MELRVLEYFVAVSEHRTVSAAAESLFVTQPAVSRQITSLEKELGTALFSRTPAGMRLTPAGARFLPIAQDILWRSRTGTAVMRGLSDESVDLVIACPPTVLRYVVAPFLAERRVPVRDIREHPPEQVYRKVQDRRADVAIGTLTPPASLERHRVLEIPLKAQGLDLFQGQGASAEQGPLARGGGRPGSASRLGESVELSHLEGLPLLVSRGGSALRQTLSEASEQGGLALDLGDGVSSGTVAQALAAGGRGVAVVVEPPDFGLDSRRITRSGQPLMVRDWAAWDPAHYAAAEIRSLVGDLEEWCRGRFD